MSYPIACTWSWAVAVKASDDEEILREWDLYSGSGLEFRSLAGLESLDFDLDEDKSPIFQGSEDDGDGAACCSLKMFGCGCLCGVTM